MKTLQSPAKYVISFFYLLVLSACNTANQEAAMTMVVQTFEARGTVAAESAVATNMGGTEIAIAEIAEVTNIALTEVAKVTATLTPIPSVTPTPTVDPQYITYLADMTPQFVASSPQNFWAREIGINTGISSLSGTIPTGMDGTVYEDGIYIRAGSIDNFGNYYMDDPSILIYDLDGKFSSFRTTIAVQKNSRPPACYPGIVFTIYLDDEKVYQSTTVFARSIDATVDVTGISRLKLQTHNIADTAAGECSSSAAVWGDPYLVAADAADTSQPTIIGTDTPKSTTGNIQGRVYWASTGDPVEGVILGLGGAEITSDAEGNYAFADLAPESYSFTLRWEFDFDGGDTPCAGLDAATMIAGNWFTNFVTLNAGGNMVIAIQNDGVEVNAGESTTFDIVFTCSD